MKRLCLLLLAVAVAALAQDGKPNFSGTWELQLDKSDFGPLPGPQSQTTMIEHKDPKLKITVNAKTAQGEQSSLRNLTTDGQENTNEVSGRTWKSKTRWEEKELVTETSFEVQGNKVQIKDRWKLSDDGKGMTIDRTLSSEMGEAVQKLVFAKK